MSVAFYNKSLLFNCLDAIDGAAFLAPPALDVLHLCRQLSGGGMDDKIVKPPENAKPEQQKELKESELKESELKQVTGGIKGEEQDVKHKDW